MLNAQNKLDHMGTARDGNGADRDRIMGAPNPPRPINVWPDPAPPRGSGQPTSPRPLTAPPRPEFFFKKTYTLQLK